MLKDISKFFTKGVLVIFFVGLVIIILATWNPFNFYSWFAESLKSVGIAVIGGGVFTSLIHSGEFIKIYSNIFYKILWSDEFLKRRGDVREVWSSVSKVLYRQKFPDISNEIESIIAEEYFPTNHEYYGENYHFTFVIRSMNNDYWEQMETYKFTIKTTDPDKEIIYKATAKVPKHSLADGDMTECKILKALVNNKERTVNPQEYLQSEDEKFKFFELKLSLKGHINYEITLQQKKILSKINNVDKRIYAICIQKNVTITLVLDPTIDVDFYQTGTIKAFNEDLIPNENSMGDKVWQWSYKGLILPRQGFIMIFKH